jgi:hypothetical protein
MQTDLTPLPRREGGKIVPHACRERLYISDYGRWYQIFMIIRKNQLNLTSVSIKLCIKRGLG